MYLEISVREVLSYSLLGSPITDDVTKDCRSNRLND